MLCYIKISFSGLHTMLQWLAQSGRADNNKFILQRKCVRIHSKYNDKSETSCKNVIPVIILVGVQLQRNSDSEKSCKRRWLLRSQDICISIVDVVEMSYHSDKEPQKLQNFISPPSDHPFHIYVRLSPSNGKIQFCTCLGQQCQEYEKVIVQMVENNQVTQTSIVTKTILCPFWCDKCSKSFHGILQ